MTGGDLLIAAAVDAAVGDPRWLPHPVRGIGLVISWCEERIRLFCKSSMSLRVAGLCLAIGLPAAVYGIGSFAIEQAGSLSALFGQAVGIALASTTLAWRDLWNHAMAVTRELAGRNMPGARQALGMIVGRDTASLSEAEIVRATVETIAESAADGVIAPLVYLTLGGAPLALAYKAINTLDSMIGHRDERYADFGWASARLDDLANWIPARLTAGFMVLTAGLATGQWERTIESWRILLRDGAKHPSPNSGRPEAAMAGALGVQLGGTNYYDGLAHERPVMGNGTRVLTPDDIRNALRIMTMTALLGLGSAVVSLWFA
jgi:adenosylcobinamide-phosphate synthase